MCDVVGYSAKQFERSIVMPNLKPPVTTAEMAKGYRERIVTVLTERHKLSLQAAYRFAMMTIYLTDQTSADDIRRARAVGVVAVKMYPAGATTNSDDGVTDIRKCYPALERMQHEGMPLLVHGEVTDPKVDVFDREAVFIDRVLRPLRADFPELKIVFEHLTTRDGVQYVKESDEHTAATITAHHLLYNRNALFTGGLRPHWHCLPVLKREEHRLALVEAATSGSQKFFLGTDSAPHAAHLKEHACGCAGCFTALSALELYTEAFEAAGALEKLEGFASLYGPRFYGVQPSAEVITLRKEPWTLPETVPFGDAQLKPLRAGEMVQWKLID